MRLLFKLKWNLIFPANFTIKYGEKSQEEPKEKYHVLSRHYYFQKMLLNQWHYFLEYSGVLLSVLACFTCLRACVLTCLACLRAYVLVCLRAPVIGVLGVFAYTRACYNEMFYFLTCLRTWCAFLPYLLYISILQFKNSYSEKCVCFVKLNMFLI